MLVKGTSIFEWLTAVVNITHEWHVFVDSAFVVTESGTAVEWFVAVVDITHERHVFVDNAFVVPESGMIVEWLTAVVDITHVWHVLVVDSDVVPESGTAVEWFVAIGLSAVVHCLKIMCNTFYACMNIYIKCYVGFKSTCRDCGDQINVGSFDMRVGELVSNLNRMILH